MGITDSMPGLFSVPGISKADKLPPPKMVLVPPMFERDVRGRSRMAKNSSDFVLRPFEGLPGEPDWVALKELVPAATATARTTKEHGAREVLVTTVLPNHPIWMMLPLRRRGWIRSRAPRARRRRLQLLGQPGGPGRSAPGLSTRKGHA